IIIRTCEPPSRYTAESMNELSVGCPLVIYMMMAHAESKQKSDWSYDAIRARKKRTREEGRPHGQSVPAWIRRVQIPHPLDPRRKVTIDHELIDDRAALLRRMHKLSQEGMDGLSPKGWGDRLICRWLKAEGIACWCRGGRWTEAIVGHLLIDRAA